MKKIVGILIISFGTIVGMVVTYQQGKKTCRPQQFLSSADNDQKMYSIAIMLPITHTALEEIQQGFVDTFNHSMKAQYTVYNAQGDRTLMRAQAEEVANKPYDLIFAIATLPSLMIKEVTAQRQRMIPIVAAAVDNPIGNNLIASMESSGNNVTAITSDLDDLFLHNHVTITTFLKPTMKKVLLPYTSTPLFEKNKNKLTELLTERNIRVTPLPVNNIQDMMQKVPLMVSDHDSIFVLRDNNVVAGIEALANLCNRQGITLCALDLGSVTKGAAIGYGVCEYDFGVAGAEHALRILKDHQEPSKVPSSIVKNVTLHINKKVAKNQGLSLAPDLLLALASSKVIE